MTGPEPETLFHLLTIIPPHLSRERILSTLFDKAIPVENGRDKLGFSSYHVADTGLQITDLSRLPLTQFNHAIMASSADAVLVFIDSVFGLERRDLWTKALSCLTGIPHILFAIDNMMMSDYDETRFKGLVDRLENHANDLKYHSLDVIPVDFSHSDNIIYPGKALSWNTLPPLRPRLDEIMAETIKETRKSITPDISDQFAVYLCWLADDPLLPGREHLFEWGKKQIDARITTLKYRLNPENMEHQAAKRLFAGNIGYANISIDGGVSYTSYETDHRLGHFVMRDKISGKEVAFGLIRHGLRRATNIHWQKLEINRTDRAAIKKQKPYLLWFTGLSGSGKSTVASLVEKKLHTQGRHTYMLDGDNIRHGLCRDLGFTDTDRVENLRRIAETAKLFVDAGLIVIAAFISPFTSERAAARKLFEDHEFIEIYIDTPLGICEQRDKKELYKKARAGQLKNFTGIDSPMNLRSMLKSPLMGSAIPPTNWQISWSTNFKMAT